MGIDDWLDLDDRKKTRNLARTGRLVPRFFEFNPIKLLVVFICYC